MRHLRIHLAGLMGLVLILGLWFALLRWASYHAVHVAFSVTLGLLLTSILLAVYRKGRRRAFWVGFLTFGFGVLIPTVIQWILSEDTWLELRSRHTFLLTTVGFQMVYERYFPDPRLKRYTSAC